MQTQKYLTETQPCVKKYLSFNEEFTKILKLVQRPLRPAVKPLKALAQIVKIYGTMITNSELHLNYLYCKIISSQIFN
jgi:hypothetical protein